MNIAPDENLKNLFDNNYIMPSDNPDALESSIISRYVLENNNNVDLSYYKDVISLVLAQLGDNSGVSFDTYIPNANDPTLGQYISKLNKVLLSENISTRARLSHATQVLSHESFHKHQDEINRSAKFLGPNQNAYSVGIMPGLSKLLGYKDELTLYRVNRSEKQAYDYNNLFMNSFMAKSRDLAMFMKDPEKLAYVEKESKFISQLNETIQNNIETAENMFISRNIPTLYANATRAFTNFVSYYLDSQICSIDELRRSHSETMDSLLELTSGKSVSPEIAVYAMASLLSVCPKKENVETFVDLVTSGNNDVGYISLRTIISNRVPITKGDFTRLSLSSNNNQGELPSMFCEELFNEVDESIWAKNMIVTLGKDNASKLIEQYKSSGKMPDTDFTAVERVLQNYSNKPLINVNGQDFYNCRDLLQFVSSRESAKYAKFSNNAIYYQTCGVLSRNLSNIINHFDTPTADNREFVSALTQFVQNPHEMLFQDEEARSEVSIVLSPKVSEKVAEYINEVREQNTVNNPQDTQFIPVDALGVSYDELFNQSVERLSQSMIKLAESISALNDRINELGADKILETLGLNSSFARMSENQETIDLQTGFGSQDDSQEISVSVRQSYDSGVENIFEGTIQNSTELQTITTPEESLSDDLEIPSDKTIDTLNEHSQTYTELLTLLGQSKEDILSREVTFEATAITANVQGNGEYEINIDGTFELTENFQQGVQPQVSTIQEALPPEQ